MKETLIIGNGDIAEAIKEIESKEDSKLYFVSGVSNSKEERESEYQREKDLLLQQDRRRHIVYCSSLCVFFADTRYTRHKIEMEGLIKQEFDRWTILRLGNITWGSKNLHTMINFFKDKIKNNESFEVKDEYRYLVDKDEFLYWISAIPLWNAEMNIVGRRMKVKDIVKEIDEGKL